MSDFVAATDIGRREMTVQFLADINAAVAALLPTTLLLAYKQQGLTRYRPGASGNQRSDLRRVSGAGSEADMTGDR